MPIHLTGTITQGHGVASGSSANSPYPAGSIAMQAPFFKALGLDLSNCHAGTLNVSIAPARWKLLQSTFLFEKVKWTDLHPAETFSFLSCEITHGGITVAGWVYYPHPETKAAHWQNESVIEIIAPRLDGLTYGGPVELSLPDGSVVVTAAQAS